MWEVKAAERYGTMVLENTEMDRLRKEQCLCLNCGVMKYCSVAKQGYEMCKTHNIAYAVTRCPRFSQQGEGG